MPFLQKVKSRSAVIPQVHILMRLQVKRGTRVDLVEAYSLSMETVVGSEMERRPNVNLNNYKNIFTTWNQVVSLLLKLRNNIFLIFFY